MTQSVRTTADGLEVGDRIDRLEDIAETLEDSDIGLERSRGLREEADEHLLALREQLDVGNGDIIEIDGDVMDLEEPGWRSIGSFRPAVLPQGPAPVNG